MAAASSSSLSPADRATLLEACAATVTGCVPMCGRVLGLMLEPCTCLGVLLWTHARPLFPSLQITHSHSKPPPHGDRQQTSWAPYGGITWPALAALGHALDRGLIAATGADPRAVAKVAGALEDMGEAVVARVFGGEDEGEEGEGEAWAKVIGAYLRLFALAGGDAEVSKVLGGGGWFVCLFVLWYC